MTSLHTSDPYWSRPSESRGDFPGWFLIYRKEQEHFFHERDHAMKCWSNVIHWCAPVHVCWEWAFVTQIKETYLRHQMFNVQINCVLLIYCFSFCFQLLNICLNHIIGTTPTECFRLRANFQENPDIPSMKAGTNNSKNEDLHIFPTFWGSKETHIL